MVGFCAKRKRARQTASDLSKKERNGREVCRCVFAAAAGEVLALKAEPGSCWHISTKEAISIRSLVKKICELNNVSFNSIVEEVGDRLGKDKNYLLDSSKVRNFLNWKDQVKLEVGINNTFKWMEHNYN